MLFLEEWITFLSRLDRLGGVPLIVGGVGLMLLGWRMRRLSVGLAFGLIGAAATMLLGSKDVPVWYAVAGGMVLASMSMWLADHAATVLGGLLGAGFTMISLGGVGFSGSALYAGGGLAFLAFAAFSYLHRPHVRIITTAFLGAVLAVSGLTVCVMAFPGLYGNLRSFSTANILVVPFFLFVPTVMSCLYQVGDMRRLMPDS